MSKHPCSCQHGLLSFTSQRVLTHSFVYSALLRLWYLKVKGYLPEGPPIIPRMRSPVFRAKAHGDLEHLCVHHVRDHSQEACGVEQVSGSREGPCPHLKHHPTPSHLPAGLLELGEFLDPWKGPYREQRLGGSGWSRGWRAALGKFKRSKQVCVRNRFLKGATKVFEAGAIGSLLKVFNSSCG